MNFLELVKARYSVRNYEERPIEQNKLDYIMEFASCTVGCKFPALEICCDNREKTAGSLEICLSP